MIVAAFAVVVLLVAMLMGGVSLLVFSTASDPSSGWAMVAVSGASVMLLGALLQGSLRASWDVAGSHEARTLHRRLLIGVVAAAIVATGAIAWACVELRTPWWAAVAAIALSAVPLACAARVGDAFRRSMLRRGDAGAPPLDDLAELRRTIRIVAATFVIAVAVAAITLVVLVHALDVEAGEPGLLALHAAGLGLVAAGVAGILRSLPANRRQRAITRGDIGLARRFGRAIYRGKPERFTDGEHAAAMEYARASMLGIRLAALSLPLFSVGLALQNVATIVDRPDDSQLQIAVVGLLLAMAVVVVPLAALQLRRTRQFLDAHGAAQA